MQVIIALIVPEWNWNKSFNNGEIDFSFSKLLQVIIALIVPEWNWNKSFNNGEILGAFAALIVPEWNWNCPLTMKPLLFEMALIVPEWNWNLSRWWCIGAPDQALIVPEWNWNSILVRAAVRLFLGFNRTRMELKCFCVGCSVPVSLGFNRTRMELKLYSIYSISTLPSKALIVPEWNWNGVDYCEYLRGSPLL